MITQEGNSVSVFMSFAFDIWFIDLGAIDHMIGNTVILESQTRPFVKSIQAANKTPMPILGVGNVSLSLISFLSSILLAPIHKNNLISISQLTKNLDCFITFYSTHCVFHDNQQR